ncbi:MAG TPA: pyruvate formate lyase family protein [Capsulimonadaceae bacterium]|jgi:formate C-acetyltransferase
MTTTLSLPPHIADTSRLGRLREEIMGRKGSFVDNDAFINAVSLLRACTGGRSRVQVRAAALLERVKLANIVVDEEWTLAGNHLPDPCRFDLPDPACPSDVNRCKALGVAIDDIPVLRETWLHWTGASWNSPNPTGLQAVGESAVGLSATPTGWGRRSTAATWSMGWTENHSIRDYAKVLRMGFEGIRAEVQQLLTESVPSDPEYPSKENFWLAALNVCDAGILLGSRYAGVAVDKASRSDGIQRKRLERIADACAQVPARGARTFHEAVQSLWLAHILTCGEDGINANSIGRLDQILYPYYQADRLSGRLTRNDAVELMEELACRLYLDYDVQAITIGGVDKDGHDAVNELSEIILEATRNAGVIRDLSIRVGTATSPAFIEHASEVIARGGGIPFIFNDDCFIKALTDRGIAVADARDYAPIGCVELTIPGRAIPHAVSGWFNALKCVELALFGGVDPRTGVQEGPRTGALETLETFEEFYAAYSAQVAYFAERMVYHCNRCELAQRERGPLPLWSVLTDDCIQRGRDITDGGAVYNYHSICFMGTANVADSLVALKHLLFTGTRVKSDDLLAALRSDFDGHEPLRRLLLNGSPKYGNDDAEVDALAARVANDFITLMDQMRSPLNGRYFVHLFSFLVNLEFGKAVGATPDGRKGGEPLAYSLSPHQGRDTEGVTAMLNSLARLPHDRAAGGSAAIVEIDPDMLDNPGGVRLLADLIRSAIAMGVGQMQWNVTTAERLQLAQDDPEHYGNIPVRVAGYSQMFKLIPRDLQNHIIARTKHRR